MATVVTYKGKDIVTGRLIGASPTQSEPKYLAWGYNAVGLTATVSDIALFREPSTSISPRTAGTSALVTTTITNDTYQVTGTQTNGAAGVLSISEAGLYDSATQPGQSSVNGGTVVASTSGTSLVTLNNFQSPNGTYIQVETTFGPGQGEVMQVTAGSGSTALTVVRARNGSTANANVQVGSTITPGNLPGQTAIAGGSMFAHADTATTISLQSGDSIAWIWKIQFN